MVWKKNYETSACGFYAWLLTGEICWEFKAWILSGSVGCYFRSFNTLILTCWHFKTYKFWPVESVHISEVLKNYNLLLFRLIFQKFPDLKFKYVEEESPEEFFIPYVWSLVYHSSNMYFNASRILLFSLSSSWEHLLSLNTLPVHSLVMFSVHEPEQIIYG